MEEVRTFFVTSRTAQGKALLQSERMALLFVDVLRNYVRAKKFTVHDFVVMRNHVHLLLSVGRSMSVEKAVQLIKGNFSFRARTELGLNCEIWQRGFSDVRINDDGSFRAHQTYIYNNPVKAGIVGTPEDFPYCSLPLRRLNYGG